MSNPDRSLAYGDPTGRQTFISLGIFTEACLLALSHLGYQADQPAMQGDVISIKVTDGPLNSTASVESIDALKRRFTDRTVYKPADFTDKDIRRLNSCWKSKGARIYSTNDRHIIEACASFTRQALLLAFSNPAFRKELTDFFATDARSPYGIPISTLGIGPAKKLFVRQLIKSGLNRNQEARAEYKKWLSASGLVFILADGDSKSYWLESGRAYLKASLEIQKMGFSQATSAAIVEAADFHEDVEKMLGVNKRIQSVIRLGHGVKKKRTSGRFSPEELLAT